MSKVLGVFRFVFAAMLVVASSSGARAQGMLDSGALNVYGGRYSPDCRNPAAPTLWVVQDALVFQNGPRRMTGRNPQLTTLYPGPNPPLGFRAALASQLDNGGRLTFLVYQDRAGLFIGLDGDPRVRSALAGMVSWRFSRCGPISGADAPPSGPPPHAEAPPPRAPNPAPPPHAPLPSAPGAGALDADAMKQYGGGYSPACADAGAPHVRVLAAALVLEEDARQLTARNLETSFSFLGQDPPKDFVVAITGDLPGGGAMTLVVFRDKHGQYLTVEDDDPQIRGVLGGKRLPKKFWSCDRGRKITALDPPTPPAAPAPSASAPSSTMPWTLLADKRFKATYRKALGPLAKSASWLMTLDGPAHENRPLQIDGVIYSSAASCKIHECGDNTVVLLYAADSSVVYGKIVQPSGARLFGAPPTPIAAALDRLWQAEFGQTQ